MTLNIVRRKLDAIPYINNGGCAIAALAMYLWIIKNEKPKEEDYPKILYMYQGEDDDYYSNAEALQNNDLTDTRACGHACISYKGNLMDSSCMNDEIEESKGNILELPNVEFVIASIKNGSWNSCFRRENIKLIDEELGINLSDLLN
jgi:hypothetical protein